MLLDHQIMIENCEGNIDNYNNVMYLSISYGRSDLVITRCIEYITTTYDNINSKDFWDNISRYQELSEEMIDNYKEYLNWDYISKWQNMSLSFIREHDKYIINSIVRRGVNFLKFSN